MWGGKFKHFERNVHHLLSKKFYNRSDSRQDFIRISQEFLIEKSRWRLKFQLKKHMASAIDEMNGNKWRIRMIFDIEKWLWKLDLGTFWQPLGTSVKVNSKNYFSFTDFFAKMKSLLIHVRKTPPLRSRCTINRYRYSFRFFSDFFTTLLLISL